MSRPAAPDEPPAKRRCVGIFTPDGECRARGCRRVMVYGYTKGHPTHCNEHRSPDMWNVVRKLCVSPGCRTTPTFGLGSGGPTHCSAHRTPEMSDRKHRLCGVDGCTVIATYGVPSGKAVRCLAHSTPDMQDVRTKFCEHPGCRVHPNYGIRHRTHCVTHRTEGMRLVESVKCNTPGCTKIARYGVVGCPAKFCKLHKEHDMLTRPTEQPGERCGRRRTKRVTVASPHVAAEPAMPSLGTRDVLKGMLETAGWTDMATEAWCYAMVRPDFIIKQHDRVVMVEVIAFGTCAARCSCRWLQHTAHCQLNRLRNVSRQFSDTPLAWVRLHSDMLADTSGRLQELVSFVATQPVEWMEVVEVYYLGFGDAAIQYTILW